MRSSIKALAFTLLLAVSACNTTGYPVAGGDAATADRTIIVAVNFDLNSHRIRPEYFATLDAVAAAMLSGPLAGYRFDVDGNTDLSGRLAYNIALSQLRANEVVSYLAARGVPPSILRAQGFGPLNLLNPGNPFGAENRRVEITSIR